MGRSFLIGDNMFECASPSEDCFMVGPGRACLPTNCTTVADCPDRPPGSVAAPNCADISEPADGVSECVLACDAMNNNCPDTMECAALATTTACYYP